MQLDSVKGLKKASHELSLNNTKQHLKDESIKVLVKEGEFAVMHIRDSSKTCMLMQLLLDLIAGNGWKKY